MNMLWISVHTAMYCVNNYRPIKIQKYSNMSIYIPILLYIVNTNKLIIVADVTYFNIVL